MNLGTYLFTYVCTIYLMKALQSRKGKYRELQGNPCNENRDPGMRTGVPCNEYRFFPVGIDLQGLGLQRTYSQN